MLAFGASLGYRMLRMGVTASGDVLIVRNQWQTRTLARRDIEGFRTGSAGAASFPGSRAVVVLLRDDSVLPLDVTSLALPIPRSRHRHQGRLEQLQAWHAGGTLAR